MLSDRERERCRSIAQALDAGNQQPWLTAETSLGPEARGLIWDLRAHVIATGQRKQEATGSRQELVGIPAATKTSAIAGDLDYWVDVEPIDDDPPDDMPECSGCRGTGRGPDGSVCRICGGKGKIPGEDQPNDGDEDKEDDEARYEKE